MGLSGKMKTKIWQREWQLMVREGLYCKETFKYRFKGGEENAMWQACPWHVPETSGKPAWLQQSELEKGVGDAVSGLSIMRGSCCQGEKVRLWLSPPLQGGPQIIHRLILGKESACQSGDTGDWDSVSGLGRSPREGNGPAVYNGQRNLAGCSP